MSISNEELARKVKETSARVEAAIADWNKTRRKNEEMLARKHFTRADVEARLAQMPAELRDHILALGEKFARRDLAPKPAPTPTKQSRKVPRSMV
jgi:DNA-binding helix-hairpin-helix protein with protein kinase domain